MLITVWAERVRWETKRAFYNSKITPLLEYEIKRRKFIFSSVKFSSVNGTGREAQISQHLQIILASLVTVFSANKMTVQN